ncbi:IMPACT family protein [Chryseobacterium chendengshani]|uniref:IMPACT family protein n=1 Tax=unclassified Chryseobacterium TaxID=2593645 RepID=UPI001C6447B7|nr:MULTISPECIES: YigZ family protein [unclassified Chryseobacterium]MBW7676138.1 YigZ family protein [Chryseobacterium sp. LJ756]MBW8524251.1 YigZ family protein [Chryseobacterium sp. LJ668]QYK17179.1 YigZ family protein [Chryseobacterium sp. LJ668]
MLHEYKTIERPVENTLLKEKGSKFIGFAFPVNNEVELKNALAKIQSEHPKATHHCYAFRIGLNGENYRANDDGEPSGSAGLPIYNQLLANEITNVLVIVVRYYGGTKLGVSGLVKAYKDSAKITLEESEIIVKELETEVDIQFQFNQQNVIFTLLSRFDAKVLHFDANENCILTASLKTMLKESISEKLSEMQHISFKFKD